MHDLIPIIKSDKNEIRTLIKECLARTFSETGFKTPEQVEKTILINGVCEDIRREFPDYTKDEIRMIFRDGCRKKYGDFFGISVSTIYQWFAFYRNIRKIPRIEPKKQLSEHKSSPKGYYDYLMKYIDEHGEIPEIWDWVQVYDHLETIGEIKLTNQEKQKYIDDAIAERERQVKKMKSEAKSIYEAMKFDDLLKNQNHAFIGKAAAVKDYLKSKFNEQ